MSTAKQHYDTLLSDVYSWMFGGFEAGIERNAAFFERLGIRPSGSRVAVDLGAGCGFRTIPLARLGFSVTAVDFEGGVRCGRFGRREGFRDDDGETMNRAAMAQRSGRNSRSRTGISSNGRARRRAIAANKTIGRQRVRCRSIGPLVDRIS
jgi:hypothetical protein